MLNLILMILLNFVVGGCIGLTGIAGFLLPMFYAGFLDMPSYASLALSFAAFLISGILGSVNYYKSGNLDLKTAGVLSAGSFVGALAGVKINLLIPADTMKIILYLVVLLSGISILLRKDKPGKYREKSSPERSVFPGTWCCNRCCLCRLRCRRAGACNADSDTARYSGAHRGRYFLV